MSRRWCRRKDRVNETFGREMSPTVPTTVHTAIVVTSQGEQLSRESAGSFAFILVIQTTVKKTKENRQLGYRITLRVRGAHLCQT